MCEECGRQKATHYLKFGDYGRKVCKACRDKWKNIIKTANENPMVAVTALARQGVKDPGGMVNTIKTAEVTKLR